MKMIVHDISSSLADDDEKDNLGLVLEEGGGAGGRLFFKWKMLFGMFHPFAIS